MPTACLMTGSLTIKPQEKVLTLLGNLENGLPYPKPANKWRKIISIIKTILK